MAAEINAVRTCGRFGNVKTIAIVRERVASGHRQRKIAADFEFALRPLRDSPRREVAVNQAVRLLPIEIFDPS